MGNMSPQLQSQTQETLKAYHDVMVRAVSTATAAHWEDRPQMSVTTAPLLCHLPTYYSPASQESNKAPDAFLSYREPLHYTTKAPLCGPPPTHTHFLLCSDVTSCLRITSTLSSQVLRSSCCMRSPKSVWC